MTTPPPNSAFSVFADSKTAFDFAESGSGDDSLTPTRRRRDLPARPIKSASTAVDRLSSDSKPRTSDLSVSGQRQSSHGVSRAASSASTAAAFQQLRSSNVSTSSSSLLASSSASSMSSSSSPVSKRSVEASAADSLAPAAHPPLKQQLSQGLLRQPQQQQHIERSLSTPDDKRKPDVTQVQHNFPQRHLPLQKKQQLLQQQMLQRTDDSGIAMSPSSSSTIAAMGEDSPLSPASVVSATTSTLVASPEVDAEKTAPAKEPSTAPPQAAATPRGRRRRLRRGNRKQKSRNEGGGGDGGEDEGWEIVEGLKEGHRWTEEPKRVDGELGKRRKWPLKGWHKRFFVLEKGILTYAKTPADVAKGKVHGVMDLGLSVLSVKGRGFRIDIDNEENIYHMKAKDRAEFDYWVSCLRRHRLYRQNEIAYGSRDAPRLTTDVASASSSPTSPVQGASPLVAPGLAASGAATAKDEKGMAELIFEPSVKDFRSKPESLAREGSVKTPSSANPLLLQPPFRRGSVLGSSGQTHLATFLLDSDALDRSNKDLAACQAQIFQLTTTLDQMQAVMADANTAATAARAGLENRAHSEDADSQKHNNRSSPFKLMLEKRRSLENNNNDNGNLSADSNRQNSIPNIAFHTAPSSAARSSSPASNNRLSSSASSSSSSQDPFLLLLLQEQKQRSEFVNTSKSLHDKLRQLVRGVSTERDRLKRALEQDHGAAQTNQMAELRLLLQSLLQQNQELRTRLSRISAEADLSSTPMLPVAGGGLSFAINGSSTNLNNSFRSTTSTAGATPTPPYQSPLPFTGSLMNPLSEFSVAAAAAASSPDSAFQTSPRPSLHLPQWQRGSLSHPLMQKSFSVQSETQSETMTEYFDAEETRSLETDASSSQESDDDEDEDALTDSDEDDAGLASSRDSRATSRRSLTESEAPMRALTGKREKLPAPAPDVGGLAGLWNILTRNVGKDLARVSMPVSLNEPLGMLQRLSEELEYSELLDRADTVDDPLDRMILVAAFAVSPYHLTFARPARKPFNPLLGETFELVREDKGFRYVGEQVSHHPPISACHADSRHFRFWQHVRLKNKFWGKSLEIQPMGEVNVRLSSVNETYTWNKVTTCVHNILGGQKWADNYGDMEIVSDNGVRCKLSFVKAGYWSSKRHEFYGDVIDANGGVTHRLSGKWNEFFAVKSVSGGGGALSGVVWRPGALPDDADLYYGFSRFAVELNELTPELADTIPPTDSRFRPDQRRLESGDVDGAEAEKQRLEAKQREKRIQREEEGLSYSPRWFRRREDSTGNGDDGSSDRWDFDHAYWTARRDPGFVSLDLPKLFD